MGDRFAHCMNPTANPFLVTSSLLRTRTHLKPADRPARRIPVSLHHRQSFSPPSFPMRPPWTLLRMISRNARNRKLMQTTLDRALMCRATIYSQGAMKGVRMTGRKLTNPRMVERRDSKMSPFRLMGLLPLRTCRASSRVGSLTWMDRTRQRVLLPRTFEWSQRSRRKVFKSKFYD